MTATEKFSESRLQSSLSLHFGYDAFRPRQLDAIKTVLSGKDCLLVLPTGGGKSMTFMLPAVASSKISIIVTPLLALAKDQVENANDNDIEAASWSSQTSERQKAALAREIVSEDGFLRLLYTTPESLQTERLLDILTTAHASNRLCMLAVDEAHAVSEWGHDFRPSYLTLRDIRTKLPGLPCLAVTATATPRVRTSIVNYLSLKEPTILLGSFNRPNLQFSVVYKEILVTEKKEQEQERKKKKKKKPMLLACAPPPSAAAENSYNISAAAFNNDNFQKQEGYKEGESSDDDEDYDGNSANSDPVIAEVIRFIQHRPGQSGIVYCRLRATCDLVASALCSADIDAASYHAGLDPERRSKVQTNWKNDGYAVVVATIAFGMGIDKPDVRYVLHMDPPASLEGLYQEAGRGGRDGQPAVALVFSSNEDLKKAQRMEKGERAGSAAAVAGYLQQSGCRRRALLAHFSEKRGPCSAQDGEELCDYCQRPGAVVSQLAKVEEINNAAARAALVADKFRGGDGIQHSHDGDTVDEDDPYDRIDPGSCGEEEDGKHLDKKQAFSEKRNTAAVASPHTLPVKRKPLGTSLKPLTFVKVETKRNDEKRYAVQQTEDQIENSAGEAAVAAMAGAVAVAKKRRPFVAPRRLEISN
jgi:superfamily II DNA helicase RecQ